MQLKDLFDELICEYDVVLLYEGLEVVSDPLLGNLYQ